MKLVYTNENNILVNHAKNILENEGVEVSLKNEHGSTGMHPQFMFLELWVNNDSDETKAKRILEEIENPPETEEWVCTNCQEKNDASFELCWHCQAPAN
jgi:hypothetical protein